MICGARGLGIFCRLGRIRGERMIVELADVAVR